MSIFFIFALLTSVNLAMSFALAARIGVVVTDGLGCSFSHLIMFDSSGFRSKKLSLIVTVTANFRCLGPSLVYEIIEEGALEKY